MKCPLMVNSYGTAVCCTESRCAWWDIEKDQCCVKTRCLSKDTDLTQTLEDFKNQLFAMKEFERMIERM